MKNSNCLRAASFCCLVKPGLDIVKLSSQRMQGEKTGTGSVVIIADPEVVAGNHIHLQIYIY